MVRFKPGAVAERMRLAKIGTGQLRDRSGLSSIAIQRLLKTNEAPKDVAEVVVRFLGTGLVEDGEKASDVKVAVAGGSKAPAADDAPSGEGDDSDEDVLDLSKMSVTSVLEAIERGDFTAAAAWELESKAEAPRTTLLRKLQALVQGG